MSGVLRHAVLALLVSVVVLLGANEVLLRSRGAAAPGDLGARYVEAARRGDAAAVTWLLRDGAGDDAAVRARLARYRDLAPGAALSVELIPHEAASYFFTARVRDGRGALLDEVGLQLQGGRFGPRWRLLLPAARTLSP